MSQAIIDATNTVANTPVADLPSLPVVDYDNHPAYAMYKNPSFSLRMKALATLLPWMGVVLFKRVTKMDRIPALPGYKGHIQGGIAGRMRKVGQYLPYIFKAYGQDFVGIFKNNNKLVVSPENEALTSDFLKSGIVAATLTSEEKQHIDEIIAPHILVLREMRAKAAKRTFEGNTMFFNPSDHPELFNAMNTYMGRHGFLEAAGKYIGRKVQVTHLLIQINDPGDAYFHNNFADCGVPDSPCNYMHVDTSYDMVKAVVYVNEVSPSNGAFSFVLGTHKNRPLGFEGVLRRAIDRAGLSAFTPEKRQLFMALPKGLRKKCTFGADLLEGTKSCDDMLKYEAYFTSAQGNMGLFANNGVHRGGLTKTGERIVFFATIA